MRSRSWMQRSIRTFTWPGTSGPPALRRRVRSSCEARRARDPLPADPLRRSEPILRGIFEGKLGVAARCAEDEPLLRTLAAELRDNPERARQLEAAASGSG